MFCYDLQFTSIQHPHKISCTPSLKIISQNQQITIFSVLKSSYLQKFLFSLDLCHWSNINRKGYRAIIYVLHVKHLLSVLWACLIPEDSGICHGQMVKFFPPCFQLFILMPLAPLRSGTSDNNDGENLLSYIIQVILSVYSMKNILNYFFQLLSIKKKYYRGYIGYCFQPKYLYVYFHVLII